jgi:hypothetical protein
MQFELARNTAEAGSILPLLAHTEKVDTKTIAQYGVGNGPQVTQQNGSIQYSMLSEQSMSHEITRRWAWALGIDVADLNNHRLSSNLRDAMGKAGENFVQHKINLLLGKLTTSGFESEVCYDGQYLYDGDHPLEDGNTQSNDTTATVVSTSAPTLLECGGIYDAALLLLSNVRDNTGAYVNANPSKIVIACSNPVAVQFKRAFNSTIVYLPGLSGGQNVYANVAGNTIVQGSPLIADTKITFTCVDNPAYKIAYLPTYSEPIPETYRDHPNQADVAIAAAWYDIFPRHYQSSVLVTTST